MPSKKTLTLLIMTLVVVSGFLAIVVPTFAASKEQVLYSFCSVSGCPDGAFPWFAGVISDAAGNLYGTTLDGGVNDGGTVFELSPGADGMWTETVLYSFCATSNCSDGAVPGGGVVFDSAGNLYGTTGGGGAYDGCGGAGCGTVFELTPGADGTWTEKVLYSFNGKDGDDPFSPLVLDTKGNIYGTTPDGGRYQAGTVFELMPEKDGSWTAKTIHNFNPKNMDGSDPQGALVIDAAENVFGTTVTGGAGDCGGDQGGCGTVFELMPLKNGYWTEKVVHSFTWGDGADPNAGLIFDSKGSLYGTTAGGGGNHNCFFPGCGTVFKLMPSKNGKWTEKVLYAFKGDGVDACKPFSPVVFDAAGNLYGTTFYGVLPGCKDNGDDGWGAVFKLTAGANGKWTETVLYSFQNDGTDGQLPMAGLIPGPSGSFIGTTYVGGTNNSGTVFEITP